VCALNTLRVRACSLQVKGVDFNGEVGLKEIMDSMTTTGFQATEVGRAIDEINRMRAWRLSDDPVAENEPDDDMKDPAVRATVKATIFFGYTSNMISSGVRETIR
jgi:deoxyhypusine synthase